MNVCEALTVGARLHSEKAALRFDDQSWSFGDLEQLSSRAAVVLEEAGVGRGDRVAIVLPNTPAFVVWYYAVLRLGAIAVSISTRLSPEEVAFIVSDCEAQVAVSTDEHVVDGHRPDCLGRLLCVSEEGATCDDAELPDAGTWSGGRLVNTEPNEAAVILYTSGTTGFPKGATLSHGNIRATVHAFNHLCQMRREDMLLLAVPLFHCYGQNALLNAGLNVGATIVLQRRFDLHEAKQLIEQHEVTKLFGVPTTFQLMLDYCTPHDLRTVEYCFSAAATLPPQIGERWRERFQMPIFEGYGLTETAPFASYNHRTHFVPGSIGTPVDLVEMKVVDPETGIECPANTPGEIAIRGPNVMLGYWNRPEETAAAVRDGWFYSGDIGRVDERGFFFIVDRLKDMISIGGMKVFPAEVERVLLDCPGVKEAAVVGLVDEVMGEKVAAFIVREEEQPATRETLQAFCQQHLGSFKTPKRVEFLDELPRNPAGKVLKTRLREMGNGDSAAADGPLEPASAAAPATSAAAFQGPSFTHRLARVHASGRRRAMIGWIQEDIRLVTNQDEAPEPDVMLLDAGLDSLMIVELRDRLQAQIGARPELPATIVFDHPTTEALAEYLVEALQVGDAQAAATPNDRTPKPGSADQAAPHELAEEVREMTEQEALQELLRELDEA